MPSASSEWDGGRPATKAVKILVAGGFGVGKTTMVSALSEIPPLHTEELISEQSTSVDDLTGIEGKTTTTVALDFGRITIGDGMILYLFGPPGQSRFWFMWDELAEGALAAVVLIDTRRLEHCFAAVDYFEQRDIPFAIGVNCFDGEQPYATEEVRDALALDTDVPIMLCDARERESCKDLMVALLEHVMVTAVSPRS